MAFTLQFKRYDTATIAGLTGNNGEIFMDTTKKNLVVQDGSTAGGINLATEGFVSSAVTSVIATVTGLLVSYPTNANLTSTLTSYATNANLTSTLSLYVTNTSLTNTLTSYTTNTNLTSTLSSYTTNANLTSTLSSYATKTFVTAALTSYTTNANLTSTLGSYTTKGPAFSAYPSSSVTQTITSGSQQKVLFQNKEFDTDNCFASSKFTPTVAGYYQLSATIRISGSMGTGESMLVIWKNGSEYKRGWNQSGTEVGVNFLAMQVSSLVYANGTTDYFEIYIQQGSGGSRDITVAHGSQGGNISWFNGSMVRGA